MMVKSEMVGSTEIVRRNAVFDDSASSDGGNDIDVLNRGRGGVSSEDNDDSNAAQQAALRAALDAYMKNRIVLNLDATADDEGKNEVVEDRKDTYGAAAEFSFRLFASSGKATAAATSATAAEATSSSLTAAGPLPTVVLEDDHIEVTADSGGIVNAPRPLSFYVVGAPTAEELARWAQVAVTGEDILAQAGPAFSSKLSSSPSSSPSSLSCTRFWGLEMPWRVRPAAPVTKAALQALLANAMPARKSTAAAALDPTKAPNALPSWALEALLPPGSASTSLRWQSRQEQEALATAADLARAGQRQQRRRPGKKRRIVLRTREKARREKEEAALNEKLTKEEHLQEKKKRLNRIKKLRKREKRRAEKAAGGGAGGNDSTSGGSDSEK